MRRSVPLTPQQQVRYAVAMEQAEAILALEDMFPSQYDEAIKVAILAGQISPEDALEQVLAHVLKYKSLDGFKVQTQHVAP